MSVQRSITVSTPPSARPQAGWLDQHSAVSLAAAGAVEAAPTAATTSPAVFPMVAVRAEALRRACEPLLVAGTLLGADHRRLHHPAPREPAPWPNSAGAPPATEPGAYASGTSDATRLAAAAAEPRYATEESPGALAAVLLVARGHGGGEDEG